MLLELPMPNVAQRISEMLEIAVDKIFNENKEQKHRWTEKETSNHLYTEGIFIKMYCLCTHKMV